MSKLKDRENIPIKILIIEDSPEIQEAAALMFDLYWPRAMVITALTGGEGIEKVRQESPDVVLLDLGLPDIDGMRVLKEIRGFSNVPVVILTVRGEEMDKIRGLEMGADDYVIKPFSHRELLARIKTALARRGSYSAVHGSGENKIPVAAGRGRLKIDVMTGQVTRDNKPIRITSTESSLLRLLAGYGGKAVPEEEILREMWGNDYTDCSEYLRIYIKRLREKIEENPAMPRIILGDAGGYSISQEALD